MKTAEYLWKAASAVNKQALPVLSFPAVQKLDTTVYELVNSSSLQAKAMQIIAAEVPTLAAMSLMDLSVEAEAFGAEVRFASNEVPTITGQLISSVQDAQALRTPTVGDGRTGVCVEAIRLAKKSIDGLPILAGVIGPYSLTGRLCDVTEVLYMCYDEPELVHMVLQKATDFLISYCLAFRSAGADGVVMAEPLAGLLSPEMSAEFSCRYVKQIVDAVQTDEFAVIYHNCGNAANQMLKEIYATGAAAYHFGNAVNMREVLDEAPSTMLCMGNISPAERFAAGTVEEMKQATRELMRLCGAAPNFIPSSGCDIPPHAKWDNIRAFFDSLNDRA